MTDSYYYKLITMHELILKLDIRRYCKGTCTENCISSSCYTKAKKVFFRHALTVVYQLILTLFRTKNKDSSV